MAIQTRDFYASRLLVLISSDHTSQMPLHLYSSPLWLPLCLLRSQITLMNDRLDPGNLPTETTHTTGSVQLLGRSLHSQIEQLSLGRSQLGFELFCAHFAKFTRLRHHSPRSLAAEAARHSWNQQSR
jgi:hypothetical protein